MSAERSLLPVSETFTSIQGEGALAGTPSWFVRLSGCNLRCRWCDTPYASWNPAGEQREIEDLVGGARASGAGHAVVTGGEPLIFPGVVELTRALREAGLHVTIETAGTVDPGAMCDLISISPKLANSTPVGDARDPTGVWKERHEARRLNFGALASLLEGAPARQLKFVVTGEDDLREVEGIVSRLDVRAHEVFLMPEGVVTPRAEDVRWVVEACVARGWRYGHRLHIELFGNVRGT